MLALNGPAVDGDLYTRVTDLAQQAPGWLDGLVAAWSDYGLALFAVLMLAAWWRARAVADPARTAMALAAPLVVVVAFLADTGVKLVFREQRPCQTLHTVTLEACPPLGDWSFPSNHAAIAAAAAAALWVTDRRLAAIAVPAALLMAFSRVWVGAHYPHDVVLGLAVGAVIAWLLTRVAHRAAPLVQRVARTRLRPLVAPR
ncbi:phosphatase PAP2 family protein [Streptomyces nojiriensis]|uniref:Phosphatase PAP2 family protein n=2 Tax=Streptomyces nojiriensis TaxID=66374 RepID=A0ABQ3SN42_9ACTN|nr:Undecaprenyl-diphosphatase BcrC [Streptomyces nojiriensis]GGS31916.1 phosphatase PAP2 family protein [Streptomyces nojiriensis]GHI69550.1 phosphatase PAP2 family protein [Streptomyces nojiriensis]